MTQIHSFLTPDLASWAAAATARYRSANTLSHGRRLSPLIRTSGRSRIPRSHRHARNGTSVSERPLQVTRAQVQVDFILFISLLTASCQVNTKQPTASPTTDARPNAKRVPIPLLLAPITPLFPHLSLSPLPLRSRTSSTYTAATTRQSNAPFYI